MIRGCLGRQGSVTTFQVLGLAVASALPTCIFCAFFSFMGFGSLNFAFLKCFSEFYKKAAGLGVALLLARATSAAH